MKKKNLAPRIRVVAYKAEAVILRHLFGDSEPRGRRSSEVYDLFGILGRVKKRIESIRRFRTESEEGEMSTVSMEIMFEWFEQLKNWDTHYFNPGGPVDNHLCFSFRCIKKKDHHLGSFRLTRDLLVKIENLHQELGFFTSFVKRSDKSLVRITELTQSDRCRTELIHSLFVSLNRVITGIESISSELVERKISRVSIGILLEKLEQQMSRDKILPLLQGEPIDTDPYSIRYTRDLLVDIENLLEEVGRLRRSLTMQQEEKLCALHGDFLLVKIRNLHEELGLIRSRAKFSLQDNVKDLVPRIRDVADEAEVDILQHLFTGFLQTVGHREEIFDLFQDPDWYTKEIDSISTELVEIYGSREISTVSIYILLEKLKQYLVPGEQIDSNLDSFRFILDWLVKMKNFRDELDAHDKMKIQMLRIRDAVVEAEVIINCYLYRVSEQRGRRSEDTIFDMFKNLDRVKNEIDSISSELVEIYGYEIYHDMTVSQEGNSYDRGSSRTNTTILEEVVVGFDDEAREIKERLVGAQRHLEVLSIVGMAGLGKTTLARKVYNDPFIVYYFHVRAWTYVSQVYQKRAVLLGILSCLVEDKKYKDKIANDWTAEMMEAEVYRRLKGKRYLIVMDDIWKIEVWNDLNRCFPNDNNCSRILFTTRNMEVASYPKQNSIHPLRFLNHSESWNLIKQKVFGKERCSPELVEIGKQIAEKCQGLPLPIVVLAGILAKEKTQDWWKQVANSISSLIMSDPKQIMGTLALSYNHLPPYLKPCFLYLGLFPENYEIPVKKLIFLWVAEGFVKTIGQKSLEDVAKDYLMDLIDKNLVLVSRRGSDGGVKECRLHDLLHELCLTKSEEENFLQQICWYDQVSSSFYSSSSSSSPIYNKHRRLCIRSHVFNYLSVMSSAPHVCSLLCFASKDNELSDRIPWFICQALKLLTVLDLSSICISSFPRRIVQLVLLRYLALWFENGSLPPSISNLWNLETLILRTGVDITLPNNVLKMVKLRHLFIRGGENDIEYSYEEQTHDGYPLILDNLQTISQLCPSLSLPNVLSRTPNLRKLGLCGALESAGYLSFPDLHFLNHLETLKFFNTESFVHGPFSLQYSMFPQNVKRLTMSNTKIGWNQLSTLGMLPNLEVLKLLCHACIGPMWETSDGRFCRLKFLKFQFIDIKQWSTDSSHFPSLEHLVLIACRKLEEIPSELGYIPTLQMIEVRECSHLATDSARQMKEDQHAMGNDGLKINIQDLERATIS